MLFSVIWISRGWNLNDSLEKRQLILITSLIYQELHCMCKLIIVVWSPCSLPWVKPPGNSQSWVIMLWRNTINRNAHECFHSRDIQCWPEVTHDPVETWIVSLAAGSLDRNNKTNLMTSRTLGKRSRTWNLPFQNSMVLYCSSILSLCKCVLISIHSSRQDGKLKWCWLSRTSKCWHVILVELKWQFANCSDYVKEQIEEKQELVTHQLFAVIGRSALHCYTCIPCLRGVLQMANY